MNDKILLSELSFEDAKSLLKNNKWLQDTLYSYAMDCISYDISEIAKHLDQVKHIRYEIGNLYDDYIRINMEYYKEFLEVAAELDNIYCILSNETLYNKVQRMINKFDFFYDCLTGYEDISDSRFEKLNRWYDSGVDEVIKTILNYVDGLTDYDEDYYLEMWLDCYGSEYATDNEYIYELEVRRHA